MLKQEREEKASRKEARTNRKRLPKRSVTLTEVNYTRLFSNYNKGDFIIGYPIIYGDTLEEGNGFTSETLFTRISEQCSNEKTQENFCKDQKFGLLVFGNASLVVSPTPAFADVEGSLTTSGRNSEAGSCPGAGSGPLDAPAPTPGPATPGSLANIPSDDQGYVCRQCFRYMWYCNEKQRFLYWFHMYCSFFREQYINCPAKTSDCCNMTFF